ncbi:MAG TPA: 2-oxoglutarate dehydrogenase E1 component, partial [Isosphaeraceae bacterium]
MNRSTVASRWNLELIEENYRRWQADPASVEASWQAFFEGFDLGAARDGPAGDDAGLDAARAQANVTRLIDAYREIGHYLADLDPLKLAKTRDTHESLEPSEFGLTEADL